ncbi:hypothetical protein Droror1_Dr00021757 [Drosera rotundifolia]
MRSLSSSLGAMATLHIVIFTLFLLYHRAEPAAPRPREPRANSRITVMGMVYCDICSNDSFSRHSYFLPGVQVKIDCKFRAISAAIAEEISFSVNRTTNKLGMYTLEVPSVEGIQCAGESAVQSVCQASLMGSSSSRCDVPGHRATSDQISIKSRQDNLCIYSLNSMTYRPARRSQTLCGN